LTNVLGGSVFCNSSEVSSLTAGKYSHNNTNRQRDEWREKGKKN